MIDPHFQRTAHLRELQAEFATFGSTFELRTRAKEQSNEGSCGVIALARMITTVWKTRKDMSPAKLNEVINKPIPCAFAIMTAKIVKKFSPNKVDSKKMSRALAKHHTHANDDEQVYLKNWAARNKSVTKLLKQGRVVHSVLQNESSLPDELKNFPVSWSMKRNKPAEPTHAMAASLGITQQLLGILMEKAVQRYRKSLEDLRGGGGGSST